MVRVENRSCVPYAEWKAYPDFPFQRDTAAHAAKARRSHLAESGYTGPYVDACTINGGPIIKLNGHTRTYVWEAGGLPKPPSLEVRLWICDTEAEARKIYSELDPITAGKTSADLIYGLFSGHGLQPQSSRIRTGNLGYALLFALAKHKPSNGQSTRDIYYLDEALRSGGGDLILMADTLGLPSDFRGSALATVFLTFQHYGFTANKKTGKTISDFWRGAVARDQGLQQNSRCDAIQAATWVLLLSDKQVREFLKANPKSGWAAFEGRASLLLHAAQKYMDTDEALPFRILKSGGPALKPLDPIPFRNRRRDWSGLIAAIAMAY